ncbi:MAG: [FeFe] hydrogenase H-cluster maturation GTPase HydF [Eubacterium sp.]|nr:[FeFe] hydrogenase H-cluster maturation GTPase HydF [Eubacterium sp.]
MSLNSTPNAERTHIGIFGRRNAGKSSLINALTGQSLAVVSDVAGTTTDPVSKAMELLPLGPVLITDTAGLDDEGALGGLRVDKSYRVLFKSDIALVVIDATQGENEYDIKVISNLKEQKIPYIKVYNKCDLIDSEKPIADNEIYISAASGKNIHELKELIAKQLDTGDNDKHICADLLSPSDIAVLVVPIDSAAPKGRLILPQQQTIRDILEAGAISAVCKETELTDTLSSLGKKPRLVITDSQAFANVSKEVPQDIPLTSFSILFARYKGDLEQNVKGVTMLDRLNDGDKILISEGCTHHRQCDDIGTVKLPRWIKEYTGKDIELEFSSGGEFPRELQKYSLIIHCGGCTLNEREMKYRLACAADAGVPMTNYGIAIAYINGILKRCVEPFENIRSLLE